jgi:phosphatidate cytidylyltransferase
MPSLLDTLDFGRPAWFLPVLTVGILAAAGIAVLVSRQPDLVRKWRTWVLIAPAVGIPTVLGPGSTAAFAAVLAVVAVVEYGRLIGLRRADTAVLTLLAVGYPVAAWLRPSLLGLTPLLVLLCAVPAVASGDIQTGSRRAAFTAFGSVWICWSLAHLVLVWPDAFLVCFAVAATDVAAWCGGKGLRRMAWARRPISPLSPNKTLGGVVGAVLGATAVLFVLGTVSVGLVLAVAVGGLFGDLLESMLKRQAQVKDAGDWLPGFGGLLDRIDSLLLALPLVYVLT